LIRKNGIYGPKKIWFQRKNKMRLIGDPQKMGEKKNVSQKKKKK